MINFFRHIRQQLLTENKFRKYLIYGIEEVVNTITGKNSNKARPLGKSRKEINIEVFLSDSELEHYISNMLALNYVAKIQMAGLYSNMEAILELINAELDNK